MGMFESLGGMLAGAGEGVMRDVAFDEEKKIRQEALEYLKALYGDIDAFGAQEFSEDAVGLGPSAMGGVNSDPALKAAQTNALRRLAGISEEGYTDQDKAAVANLMADINSQERGNRLAIQSKLDPNSGAALAAQLGNQQAMAQKANLQGLNQAANSRAQALRALSQYGSMAGQMRDQDFGEQSDKARAADAVARFNAQNSQAVAGRNTDRRMDVKRTALNAKLGQSRAIAGQRTGDAKHLNEYIDDRTGQIKESSKDFGRMADESGSFAAGSGVDMFGDDIAPTQSRGRKTYSV